MSEHELGCCGYDELAYKPPTTRPLRLGMPTINLTPKRSSNYPIANLGQFRNGPQVPELEHDMPYGAFPVPWGGPF